MIYISIGFLIIEKAETFYGLSLVYARIIYWLVFPAAIIAIAIETIETICIDTDDIFTRGVERGSIQNSRLKTLAFQPLLATVIEHPAQCLARYRLYSPLDEIEHLVILVNALVLAPDSGVLAALDCKGIVQSSNSSIRDVHIVTSFC